MHSYIYHKRKKKKKIYLKILGFIVIIVILLQLITDKSIMQPLKNKMVNHCYRELVYTYIPYLKYNERVTEKTMAETAVHLFLPYQEENQYKSTYEKDVESKLSYEMILALEARDENYIDEKTGELVLNSGTGSEIDDNASMNQDMALSQEGVFVNQGTLDPNATSEGASTTFEDRVKQLTYPVEKLADFDYLIQNFYQVDRTTTIDNSRLNANAMLQKSMKLSHDATTPQILIYHTHSQEAYADSIQGDPSMTVVGVGEYLTQLLRNEYGLNVIHHTGEYDIEDRDHAYSLAGPALEKILAENPSIEVVIDLHRDGVGENTHLVTTQDGVNMAQVMFFNGLSRTTSTGDIAYLANPYIEDNLAFSFQMQLTAAEYFPGFTRRIYLKGYRYNMHYCPKTLLVEVGAQTNTVEEAKNAMVPLAETLYRVLVSNE